MNIQDIIEAINNILKDGHYVLHRSMEVQPIKIYKKFLYQLVHIKSNSTEVVLTHQSIDRTIFDMEQMWEINDKIFLSKLLEWFKYGKLKDE